MDDAALDYITDRTPPDVVEPVLELWKQLDVFLVYRDGYEWWERAMELNEDPWFIKRGAVRKVYVGVRADSEYVPGVVVPHIAVDVESDTDDMPRHFTCLNIGSLEYLLEALEWRIGQPDTPVQTNSPDETR